jgi:hypothetical protein
MRLRRRVSPGEDRDVVIVRKATPGGQFEVVKDEIVIGQILAEARDPAKVVDQVQLLAGIL